MPILPIAVFTASYAAGRLLAQRQADKQDQQNRAIINSFSDMSWFKTYVNPKEG